MKRKNPPMLDIEHARTLYAKIDWEGDLAYTIENWDFAEFKDKKFNSVRKAFLKAKADLEAYCRLDRVDDEMADEAEAEAKAEEDKVCNQCGDALNRDGVCESCQFQEESEEWDEEHR